MNLVVQSFAYKYAGIGRQFLLVLLELAAGQSVVCWLSENLFLLSPLLSLKNLKFRSIKELLTTETEDIAIAAAAIHG